MTVFLANASPIQHPDWSRRDPESTPKDPNGMSVLSRYARNPILLPFIRAQRPRFILVTVL